MMCDVFRYPITVRLASSIVNLSIQFEQLDVQMSRAWHSCAMHSSENNQCLGASCGLLKLLPAAPDDHPVGLRKAFATVAGRTLPLVVYQCNQQCSRRSLCSLSTCWSTRLDNLKRHVNIQNHDIPSFDTLIQMPTTDGVAVWRTPNNIEVYSCTQSQCGTKCIYSIPRFKVLRHHVLRHIRSLNHLEKKKRTEWYIVRIFIG
jgi:hypothetical protein